MVSLVNVRPGMGLHWQEAGDLFDVLDSVAVCFFVRWQQGIIFLCSATLVIFFVKGVLGAERIRQQENME